MDWGKALLGTGKFMLKATACIAEVAVSTLSEKVETAYRQGQVDKDKYDEYKNNTDKLSRSVESFKKVVQPKN